MKNDIVKEVKKSVNEKHKNDHKVRNSVILAVFITLGAVAYTVAIGYAGWNLRGGMNEQAHAEAQAMVATATSKQ